MRLGTASCGNINATQSDRGEVKIIIARTRCSRLLKCVLNCCEIQWYCDSVWDMGPLAAVLLAVAAAAVATTADAAVATADAASCHIYSKSSTTQCNLVCAMIDQL